MNSREAAVSEPEPPVRPDLIVSTEMAIVLRASLSCACILAICACTAPNPLLGETGETGTDSRSDESSSDTSSGDGTDTDSETLSDETDPDSETDSETTGCDATGCPCILPEDCAEGLACENQVCTEVICGDGLVHSGEQCDDMNAIDGDGCDADCSYTEILSVDAGGGHTCVVIEGGRLRCWGLNGDGQLGLGHTLTIGDDELPNSEGDVPMPGLVTQVSGGLAESTCARLESGAVYCWGKNSHGQLGIGSTEAIGDDEHIMLAVSLGEPAKEVQMGSFIACARLDSQDLHCWGYGGKGQLGYGNTDDIGDNELPDTIDHVPVGGTITGFTAGGTHTCAVSTIGTVRCWGENTYGQLGYGHTASVGVNNTPDQVGDAPIRPEQLPPFTKVTQLAAGVAHTCALFETGDVLCWGLGNLGQLGTGTTENLGDNEFPSTSPPIDLPSAAVSITAGSAHTCALLDTGDAYCWGSAVFGQLGYGNTENIGDDEPPSEGGPIDAGGVIAEISAGFFHTCARTETNEVRCWGNNDAGQLGQGNTSTIGNDELPSSVPPVSIF